MSMRFAIRAAVLLALVSLGVDAAPPEAVHLGRTDSRVIDGRTVVTTIEQDGRRRLVRRCNDGLCGGTWFDGERTWTFGINGVPLPDDGADNAMERALAGLPLPGATAIDGPLLRPRGLTPEITGNAAVSWIDGQAAIVPCRIRDRDARCLIDTGTTPSAMTLALADALGLEPHGELEMTAARRFLTGVVEAGPLTVGNARWARASFAIVPRSGAVGFDAIIGNDIIATLRVTLDARARTLRFASSEAMGTTATIPLHFARGRPLVDGAIGGEPESLLLDTGDTALASVGYGRYRRGGLRSAGSVDSAERADGIAGSLASFTATAEVVIGTFDAGPSAVSVNAAQTQSHAGLGLAARCRLTIDEPAERAECALPR